MKTQAFFDVLRRELGPLGQGQVDGCLLLLVATARLTVRQRAYVLATAWHETAATMQPIPERGARAYFNKYEPGTAIGRNLGNSVAGDGYRYRGRGYVQLTGRRNYHVASRALGRDFVGRPEDAMIPELAARILVEGMMGAWFTGRALPDYISGERCDYREARRVVNGLDRADRIAGLALTFERAIAAARIEPPLVASVPPPPDIEPPDLPTAPGSTHGLPNSFWARLWARVFG